MRPELVAVHPTVLLSIVDHYNRAGRDVRRRVVGVLLGEFSKKGVLEVSNSYAVPFEEDPRNPKVWFFDHNYHETMYSLLRKINAREKVVGWYSSGTEINKPDIHIHDLLRKYCGDPVYVTVDVQEHKQLGIPTEAYCSVEELDADGNLVKNFVNVPSTIDAYDAESVGVEHLLRDIRDVTIGNLSKEVYNKVVSLKALTRKIAHLKEYLTRVAAGELEPDADILYNVQDIFNLLPNLKVEELVRGLAEKSNNMYLLAMVSATVRATLSLHSLINNKISNLEAERAKAK